MILALSGSARSGKDTIADYLVEHHGYVKMSFADPIREALYRLNPEITDMSGLIYKFQQAVNLFGWEDMKEYFPMYRVLMQRMGTEVGREMFGEDIWVNAAMERAKGNDRVVLADCRYPNEADAVRALGGKIWRVERDGVLPANEHASEHAMVGYDFDRRLDNSAELDVLYELVDKNLI
jgi:hypothetical protein